MTKTFSATNESISATYINNNAYSDTTITENMWNNILDRLNILDVADSINLDSSQIGSYSPGVGIVITRADYNRLVKAIELVAKACKCNSDCACNLVCNCNADCGCNYSDERLKENIIFLNYESGLKIYQYNYMKYRTRGFFLKFTFNFKSGKETEDISRDSSAREILRRTGN